MDALGRSRLWVEVASHPFHPVPDSGRGAVHQPRWEQCPLLLTRPWLRHSLRPWASRLLKVKCLEAEFSPLTTFVAFALILLPNPKPLLVSKPFPLSYWIDFYSLKAVFLHLLQNETKIGEFSSFHVPSSPESLATCPGLTQQLKFLPISDHLTVRFDGHFQPFSDAVGITVQNYHLNINKKSMRWRRK